MHLNDSHTQDALQRIFATKPTRHVLPNGLSILHKEDFSSEVVSVQVWVRTGSIHEGTLLGSGLSHYLEHMLFKGTARRDGKSISREVHAMGGAINAYTSFDRTVYYIDAPSSAFKGAIDILEDIVLHSALPEEEVERERDVILREIDMGLDDPDRRLNHMLFSTAFKKHPTREPVIGHRELFEQVSHAELEAYYKARYVPNNIVVSVAGAIHSADCIAKIESTFGKVPRGRLAPILLTAEPEQLAFRRHLSTGDFNIYRGGMAFKVPHLSHEDSPSLDALAHALGGGESSILWRKLRNEGNLVHYIDCRNWNPGERGLFWISYVCDADKAQKVESEILKVIEELKESGLGSQDLAKAQRQALTAEINGRKTMSGQASRQAMVDVIIGDLDYTRRYLQRLSDLQPSDLQASATKYLTEAGRTVVGLGPSEDNSSADEQDATLGLEAFEQITCEGGSRILLQRDRRLPKVHLRCVVRAGAYFEPSNQRGISELLAELLSKDTEKRSAEEIDALIEGIGGSFSTSGGNNTLNLALEVLPSDLPIALDLLKEALLSPRFNERTFTTERDAQIAGLKEEDDEILDFGFRKLREEFFGADPLSVGASGRVGDLESLNLSNLSDFYKQLVTSDNIVLSVCGDFEKESTIAQLKEILAVLPQGAKETAPQPELNPELPKDLKLEMAREQAVVLQSYPCPGIQDEAFVASELLNELFSGMSSRLFERVREDQGMAYYVGSTRVIGLRNGMFAFYAGTHPAQADAVMHEIDQELARVRAGELTEEELERCRTRLKAARPMSRQTIGARAMHAAIQCTYGLPLDDDKDHSRKLDALTAGSLAEYAARYFKKRDSVRMIVGPKS